MGVGIVMNIPSMEKPKIYAIAYLDLLGTTSKIVDDKDGLYLFRIRSIYNMAVQFSENEKLVASNFSRIETKIFSDNIVIAIPLESDHDINGITCLLKFVAIFQHYAAIQSNWLIRGGITIGELFIDKLLVWGSGLIRAYQLESSIAIFPRIVIDHNVLEILGTNSFFFYRDIDGQFFLNFLNFMSYRDSENNDNFIPTIQKSFAELLSEIKKPNGNYDEKAYQKLQWYKNYINLWSKERYPGIGSPPISKSILD